MDEDIAKVASGPIAVRERPPRPAEAAAPRGTKTSGARDERERRRSLRRASVSVAACLVGGLCGTLAHAHGYMTYPSPRAVEHLAGDSKGWPIAGIKARFRREPCLGLARGSRRTTLRAGPMQLRFLFPDGANHVGACSAFLLDPLRPERRVGIGEMVDCARSEHRGPGRKGEDIPGRMPVVIPDELPCDPQWCVLQWVWIATHRSATDPDRYEHYDNCADVRIVGARRAGADGEPAALASAEARTALAEGHVLHMLSLAVRHAGDAAPDEALERRIDRIEALRVDAGIDPPRRSRAQIENRRGVALLRDGRLAESVAAFSAAYGLDPTDAEIVNNLGYALFRDGDPEAAEPLLRRALVLEPERANAWANFAQSYAGLGDHDRAVAALTLAYRYSADRRATRRFLGRMAAGDDRESGRAAKRALELLLAEPEDR